VIDRAQELFLGVLVSGGPVAADAYAEEAGAAAFPLRLPDGVEYAQANALNVAVRAPAGGEGARQRVLGAHVFAPAALEDQPDVDVILAMLVPVEDRAPGAQVGAGVATREAVHRVLAEVALGGGVSDGVAGGVGQRELVEPDRGLDVEGDRSGVLADRGGH